MGKSIVLIHGRSWKPAEAEWRKLWRDALAYGVLTDFPDCKKAWQKAKLEFVYYGDLSNQFLMETDKQPPPADDLLDRWASLEELMERRRTSFTKRTYLTIPNRRSWMEALADTVGALANVLRVGQPVIEAYAPDMDEYWNPDSEFGEHIRARMIGPLKRSMNRGDEILVISHSLGSLVAYDTFWKFCHTAEYTPRYSDRKIQTWITLGSPLGDETAKRNLRGARAHGPRKYPDNIRNWINIYAEDDFVSHDGRLRNDYRKMIGYGCIDSIKDIHIYNLAIRHGSANQHSSAGYLIHPKVSAAVALFLR